MVHKSMRLRLILLTTIIQLYSTSHAEIFSAISELEPLLATQKKIIDDLDVYIIKEEERIRVLKRYLNIYKQEHEKAMIDVPNYIGNPVNAFQLIKRLSSGLIVIEDFIKYGAKNAKNVTRFHKDMKYPKHEDLTGAARAISRLQKIYKLNAKDISQGMLFGVNYSTIMTTDDCFELGRTLHMDKDHKHGKEWLYEAYTKYLKLKAKDRQLLPFTDAKIKEMIDITVLKCRDIAGSARAYTGRGAHAHHYRMPHQMGYFLCSLLPWQEEIRVELKRKEHMRELYPPNERPDWHLKKDIMMVIKRYAALCRGELGVPRSVSKRFKCWYSNKSHPFLKYAPIKVEQLYIKPDILIFYDVLNDDEIQDLKHMSKLKQLYRAQVYDAPTNTYVPAKSRICKSTWFKDHESPTVAAITRRVGDMTGLVTHTAEETMVINYGIAGHYDPHYDFAQLKHEAFARFEGNRIATVLFYMSDVEHGGATVFTDIGVKVNPVKGAALFWYNLHRSGSGDMATRHGACPVIKGSKWISSKWLHEGGQELIRPCTLENQPEGYLEELPRLVKKTVR